MTEPLFWANRIIESGAASPQELAKGMHPLNWRGHPEQQREALEEALDSLGILQPVLFNRQSGRVIDGHLRIELAVLKGQPLIPVNYVDLDDDEEALALATLDAITEQAQPIPEKLAALLERTRVMTADKPGLAAMLAELKARAGVNGKGEPPPQDAPPIDKAEELQKKWQVQPGQIYQIGPHFIICGDCREPETWQRLLSVAKVDKVNGVFTSPPYAEQRKAQYGGVPVGEYVQWWEAVQGNVREWLAGDGSFFVNIKPHCEDGQRNLYVVDLVCTMVRQWEWLFVEEFCWTHQGVAGYWPNRFKNGFEPVYQFSTTDSGKFYPDRVKVSAAQSTLDRIETAKRTGEVNEGRKNSHTGSKFGLDYANLENFDGLALPSNVIRVSTETTNVNHAAAFPVALPTFFLKAYSDPGDSWLDPFAGSGTTIVSAHNEGRIGLGIERFEKYCAVILERLQTLTGIEPKLT